MYFLGRESMCVCLCVCDGGTDVDCRLSERVCGQMWWSFIFLPLSRCDVEFFSPLQFTRDCGSASARCLQLAVKKDTGNSSGFSAHPALIRTFWWAHFGRDSDLVQVRCTSHSWTSTAHKLHHSKHLFAAWNRPVDLFLQRRNKNVMNVWCNEMQEAGDSLISS